MVYPIGYGRGSAGVNGTGFQLLAIMFTEFFGVTLAQLVGALAPSIQVCRPFYPPLPRTLECAELENESLTGRDVVQFCTFHPSVRVLWCNYPIPSHSALVTVAVRIGPLGQDHQLNAHHRTPVRPSFL